MPPGRRRAGSPATTQPEGGAACLGRAAWARGEESAPHAWIPHVEPIPHVAFFFLDTSEPGVPSFTIWGNSSGIIKLKEEVKMKFPDALLLEVPNGKQ
jgi:hypothetical protein